MIPNNLSSDQKKPLFQTMGTCPDCTKPVYSIQLYVYEANGDEDEFYHFSCYNLLKEKQADTGDQ